VSERSLKEVIGTRIREERKRAGLTQEELAEQVGIDAPRLSRIEQGKRGIDSLVLRRVAGYFDLSMDAFFVDLGAEEVALARRGDLDGEAMERMIDWGRRLQDNMRFVQSELARRG
jgi:transcriptional regulator with XRE-family HTH domain